METIFYQLTHLTLEQYIGLAILVLCFRLIRIEVNNVNNKSETKDDIS